MNWQPCASVPPKLVKALLEATRRSGLEHGAALDLSGSVISTVVGGPSAVRIPSGPILLHTHPTAAELPSTIDRLTYALHGEAATCIASARTGRAACYWRDDLGAMRKTLQALVQRIAIFNEKWQAGERDMKAGAALKRERDRLLEQVAAMPLRSCQIEEQR